MLRSIGIGDQQDIWLARTEAFWRAVLQFMAVFQASADENLFQAARRS